MTNALTSVPVVFWALEVAWSGARRRGLVLGALALAFQVFVRSLDRDDADPLVAGQRANRRQRLIVGEVVGQDPRADLPRDLCVEWLLRELGENENHGRTSPGAVRQQSPGNEGVDRLCSRQRRHVIGAGNGVG